MAGTIKCDRAPPSLFATMAGMRRRSSLTILPLIIAVAFAAFQHFGAEKVTIPETGREARVALSSEEEEALGLQSYREVIAQSDVVRRLHFGSG